MFEFIKKLTGLDLSGAIALPPWMLAFLAAAAIVGCAFLAMRGMHRVSILSVVAACVIAGTVVWVFDRLGARDRAAEQRSLDEHAFELKLRALSPGSPLACLEGVAPAIQDACEKALFASPETTAAAVTYVSAQISLLTDARKYVEATALSYSDALAAVRGAIERDQFGIVAHVLEVQRGCRPDRCDFFALFQDTGRMKANLAEHAFDSYIAAHTAEWAAHGNRPMADGAGSSIGAVGARRTGNLFFPSSSSIPPVTIMTPEAREATASAETPVRPRKSQELAPQSRPAAPVETGRAHSGPLQIAPSGQ